MLCGLYDFATVFWKPTMYWYPHKKVHSQPQHMTRHPDLWFKCHDSCPSTVHAKRSTANPQPATTPSILDFPPEMAHILHMCYQQKDCQIYYAKAIIPRLARHLNISKPSTMLFIWSIFHMMRLINCTTMPMSVIFMCEKSLHLILL